MSFLKEWEIVKNKYEKDFDVLRNERIALEETISTMRNECDNLKTKLNKEFEKNDDLKSQVNRLTKGSKESEEKKLFLLQSLYKRLLPLLMTNKTNAKQIKLPTDIREEKNLEEFIDKIITQLVDRLSNIEEKESKSTVRSPFFRFTCMDSRARWWLRWTKLVHRPKPKALKKSRWTTTSLSRTCRQSC